MYKSFFKRVFDLVAAILGFVVLFPVFAIVWVILFIQNNGKVFFYQVRPGYNQKAFSIIKFKTMTDKKDSEGNLLPDTDRITKAGGIIRKLSLDELPQLINVIKGDMSLVGPRPLLFKYIPLYSEVQLKRHDVKPGITGWAQVNGRNSIAWTKKFELDVYYVENVSLLLDIKILLLTVKKVLIREGVNNSDARPMYPFDGTN
ncbi:sugar transferase [uncultured Flavobacterium sp.]|uniref:sugar transferase n=1 Tax=uncultured Flavobacterium sp. TaxID=165435 RepID=UPI0025FD17BC|nr:sugar transferase [uncultured Flavobacterium sp.]